MKEEKVQFAIDFIFNMTKYKRHSYVDREEMIIKYTGVCRNKELMVSTHDNKY